VALLAQGMGGIEGHRRLSNSPFLIEKSEDFSLRSFMIFIIIRVI
jgi:hypothetical protein